MGRSVGRSVGTAAATGVVGAAFALGAAVALVVGPALGPLGSGDDQASSAAAVSARDVTVPDRGGAAGPGSRSTRGDDVGPSVAEVPPPPAAPAGPGPTDDVGDAGTDVAPSAAEAAELAEREAEQAVRQAAEEAAAADRAAGVLGREVPARADGVLVVVPGSEAPPREADRVVQVRVEVESGLAVDPHAFARFAMDVLNDPRGWGADGSVVFARTDGPAPFRVTLASPSRTDELCAPLRTIGLYSCGRGGVAALNAMRWVEGAPEFTDMTQYRSYLVNHEVGHLLGYPHVPCPGAGLPAPIMQQQTISVAPCVPNGWPFPDGAADAGGRGADVSGVCDLIGAVPILPPRPPAPLPPLDAAQRAVVAHRGPSLRVRGAPGSGRTTAALALVLDRLHRQVLEPEQVLLLAPTRRSAAQLRDVLSAHLGRTTGGPLVRTAASAAFAVLRARAALRGEPPPVLVSGPEQDLVLGDLLAGHAEGEGLAPTWPATVPPEARALRGFRDELRDLLMRAAERGLEPADLHRLGKRHDRPQWCAAAQVHAEYLAVTRLRSGTPDVGMRVDPAAVVDEAAEALQSWHADGLPDSGFPRWSLVVVDDHQESTAATARLLHVLQRGGADLVLTADPDSAVQTFRGAMPALVHRATVGPAGSELGAYAAEELVLPRVHRSGSRLRRVVRDVTDQVRGPVRDHRDAEGATEADGSLEVALLRSPAQQAAHVARVLRDAHLHEGVPWEGMAVIARSGGLLRELRRALPAAEVPVEVEGSDVPLRSEPAVRPLLLAVARSAEPDALAVEDVVDLLASPLIGLDAVGLRRVRRALRREELDGGGGRTSDPLLLEAVQDPARAASLPASVGRPLVRLARVLEAGRRAATEAGATASDVLWAVWDTAGVAQPWRRAALVGGPGGDRADRDLDAVLALFATAERFVERFPRATVGAFVEHVVSQDVPADSLAARAAGRSAVALLTPAGAAGREWDLVVVAGVQEGVWPDLRLRDSLLGAQHLVDVLAGRAAHGPDRWGEARAAVLDDELRAFAVAVSRARRRLVVTAVEDADHLPSPLVDLVQPPPDQGEDPRRVAVGGTLDLRGVVARGRAELEAHPDPAPEHPAARLLARLAAEGVPEADPSVWYGAEGPSTDVAPWPESTPVVLSPSRLEAVATCALRWALEAAGGTAASSREQSLGTLVHEIAAEHPHADLAALSAELERRWHELGVPQGWVGAVTRRRADSMVQHLAEYLRGAGDPLALEGEFQVEVDGVVLRGVVDRVEKVGEDEDGTPRVRVVDLKTGRTAVTKEVARRNPQLGAYQLALEEGAFAERTGPARNAGAALVYVGRTARTPCEREQVALEEDAEPGWARELVAEAAVTVRRPVVAARTNDLCRVCPVQRCCPLQDAGQVTGR